MEEGKATVRAVDRALDILLCFTEATELSMTDISVKAGLHKSTVHRLLLSLEHKGFVIRDGGTDKYRLGFRIWELSAQLSESDISSILLPEMERLRDEIGETISLYVRDGKERIRIQAVQSKQSVRRVAPIGARLPLYVGASSKILLAYASMEDRKAVLHDENWPVYMEREAFEQQLETIRLQGYATSIEEREAGAAAVAVPLFNRSNQLAASLSISGPANRLTMDKMREHARVLQETARKMGNMIRS
ncbi:IclR family transcriptional regulator [Marinicrinis sediminis]|uniref:IclR family transcriptional regulator n=1 Tax=Marinicrinis sediminis TaxID=1652465 RepID=A0ABW5RGL6_9BACL